MATFGCLVACLEIELLLQNQQHLAMNTIIKDFALGLPVHMPIHALNAKWPILHAHVVCIWSRGT